jgi:SAM-dependent methyltransferase
MKADKRLASNEEWQAWGKLDPLYAVAAIEEHAKSGGNPWTDGRFYEIGAIDWDFFRPNWEQYGLTPGTCVEIGCGAGRLTGQLAQYFQTVHGLDVSASMIEYARAHVPSNVSFHVTGGLDIPLADDSADAIFSTHVLQHLPHPTAVAAYLREMHRVLRPGGTVMLHVPLIVWPWGSLLGIHKLVHALKVFVDRCRTQLGRYGYRLGLTKTPPMHVIWCEISWLYDTLQQLGFKDAEIRVLLGRSKMAVQHPFVLARKK